MWDPGYKQIFCLLFAEKLSYKVCDESLVELDKLSQGINGMLSLNNFILQMNLMHMYLCVLVV